MARLLTTGFENGALYNADSQAVEAGLSGGSTVGLVQTGTKRTGSYAARITTGTTAGASYVVANESAVAYYARVYLNVATFHTSAPATGILNFMRLGWINLQLQENGTGFNLYAASGATLNVGVSHSLSTGLWYRVELEISRVAAAGSHIVGLYVDGVQIYRATNLSLGSSVGAQVDFAIAGESGNVGDFYIDDCGVNDSSGSVHNTLPGAGSVIHLRPDGAGDADTGMTAGDWHDAIDEVTPDDADFATLPTNPSELVVSIGDATSLIGASDTIQFVEVHGFIGAASNTTSNWFPGIMSQSSGTKAYASAVTRAASLFSVNDDGAPVNTLCKLRQHVDPQAGGAWTLALLNSTQIIARTTDGNPDTYVGAMWALVEYIPAPVLPPPMRVINHRALSRAANF
jgi:hypothetical protein